MATIFDFGIIEVEDYGTGYLIRFLNRRDRVIFVKGQHC